MSNAAKALEAKTKRKEQRREHARLASAAAQESRRRVRDEVDVLIVRFFLYLFVWATTLNMAEAPAQTRAACGQNAESLATRVSQLEAEIAREQAARREAEARIAECERLQAVILCKTLAISLVSLEMSSGSKFVGRDYAKMRSRKNRSSERSFSSRQGAVKALIIFSCGVPPSHSDTAYAKCENERIFCETLCASNSLMTERKHTV